jgi:predicted RNase H-like HicB family nuclease
MDNLHRISTQLLAIMRNVFMAIVVCFGRQHTAYCPEIEGVQGKGHTKMAALEALRDAVALTMEQRREKGVAAAPAEAVFDMISVECD